MRFHVSIDEAEIGKIITENWRTQKVILMKKVHPLHKYIIKRWNCSNCMIKAHVSIRKKNSFTRLSVSCY